ncbi:MAG: UDP-N-acetylglucosamine 1-carboxyvinyltransferase [Prolixibacteraceae bacterium]|jgi:UDP-N-acetylglucosamine 1-carboxyvinyltransferase|nr:UDP-N-acetylglucosamine 1-carboxyvinyltransferase [Prolixibacteraceae bacterium]
MARFIIEGGNSLAGTLTPQGAKNEALQVICATLLTNEKVTLSNIPEISDVLKLIDILKYMGVSVERPSKGNFTFCADKVNVDILNSPHFFQQAAALRGSIMIIGPMLARFGKGTIPQPGGDKIGRRRLDTHFRGFESLGAQFIFDAENALFRVEAKKLKGCYILLDEASVTGTANLIMAAVMAEGTTTIYNAACEPYVQQLCRMLISMGAKIDGTGSNLLHIHGVTSLKGCDHRLLPDMIEVGSFIGLAAMTSSDLLIKDVAYDELGVIPDSFRKMGINLIRMGDDIRIPVQDHYEIESFIDGSIMTIADAPWPGLTPDLLSIFLVVATQARGSVLIHQKMFESRLFFVDRLIDMGSKIILCDPHRATVIGLDRSHPLRATRMTSPDIRAGVALLIAALSANGVSTIDNIDQIDRGYENIDIRLNAIGAKIRRE